MKVACVFGTRPEAIKMAPVIKALEADPFFEVQVLVTAQHREMLDQVLELFNIKAQEDLNIMTQGQTIEQITSRALLGLGEIFGRLRPDLVLVHGDTSTTFAGALAAFYARIPVGHVEAGLRTYDKFAPYPEEMNRQLTSRLADLHFAPTQTAYDQLLRENIKEEEVVITGNTVIDALLQVAQGAQDPRDIAGLEDLDTNKKIILVTSHRRENLGQKMKDIFSALADLAREKADEIGLVVPMHLNPKVRTLIQAALGGLDNVHLIEPLSYGPFVSLMKAAHLIVTDSGGIQEEAPSLGKPVLVLRDRTERPEAIQAGTVRLCGTDYAGVYEGLKTLLEDPAAYQAMSRAHNPYGDGKAARRIAEALRERYQKKD